MTTFIRPAAVARSEADMLVGWNIDIGTCTLQLVVSTSTVIVMLLTEDGLTLLGSGVGAIGTAQTVLLTPYTGQSVDMVDESLGWHLLLTLDGTEGERTIVIDPMVDLTARTHPVYADGDLALAVATADIDTGTHYVRDITVTCPLVVEAEVGDIISVPVDGAAVVGQLESITRSGDPDGTSVSVVIREYTQIRPDAYTDPIVPTAPTAVDDEIETDDATPVTGNILDNDSGGDLYVIAVAGLMANVGVAQTLAGGAVVTINADGSYTIDPTGCDTSGGDVVDTIEYSVSNGEAESAAWLTVTVVASAQAGLWTPSEITTALWLDAADEATITLNGSTASQWSDKSGNARHATQSTASKQPSAGAGLHFDGADDEMALATITTLNSPNATMFIVAKRDNAAGRAEIPLSIGSTSGDGIVDIPRWTDNLMRSQVGYYASRATPASTISDQVYQTCVTGGVQQHVYVHGALEGTGTAQSTSAFSVSGGYVGSGRAVSGLIRYFAGTVYEIVIEPTALSDTDRQIREGYLAHKWDGLLGVTTLVDALPSDHPYKSAAPTV